MERYKRQISLIGEEGQSKLQLSSVLIVGAGGLGNICAKFLASSGVGYIEIWDDDRVEESNLNRQILFSSESKGKNKARALAETIRKINPNTTCDAIQERFKAPFDLEYVDVVIDCSDNLETSYYLEELALKASIPLVFAKTSKWFGVVMVIRNSPYLQKNYPKKQLNKDNSVIAPIGGIVGSFQANMALKLILGEKVSNKIHHFDILNDKFIAFNKE